jgi:DNA repair exonuclease SbcCD ATPase subunit
MSDLIFNSVEFKNFMSFGNLPTLIQLDNPGTTLIVGENLDDGGSSGAGTTTLFGAISYACFDKIPSGVSKDRLINQTNDKKNTSMEVAFTFTTNGHTYKVIRKRGVMGGLQLLEDDKDITPASSGAFNEKIEQLLGISYNMFSQVILFSGNSRPFLDFGVSDQRILIEELFRITTLSQKANACKKRGTQTDKDIALQKLLIQQQQKQNDTHRKHLAEAKDRADRWESQRSTDLLKLKQDIDSLSEVDFDTNEALLSEISTLQSTLVPLQSEIRELTTKLTAKKNERFAGKTEMALLNANVSKKTEGYKKLTTELSHLADAKCPYCLQQFQDAEKKIAELEAEKVAVGLSMADDKEQYAKFLAEEAQFALDVKTAVENLTTEIETKQQGTIDLVDGVNELKSALIYASVKDLTTAKNSIAAIQSKLDSLATAANPHVDAIRTLETEGEVTVEHDKLEELITLQEHQQFLIKLLMDKNSFIRKNIISKTIPFLNKRIGYYTEKLNLPHLAMFQPDMSCQISQYGRELDHGNLSNGEKKRLNLSLCLAFRDVLTYLHARVNVLFTDEIDGGSLDSNCLDSLIQLLKKKAWDDELGIYIISHRPEFDGRCDRNLIVRKERGFSNIITQPDE